ncbi:DUF6468 domain-containing protein [Azospirillum rugosum]|uniref:DUF6468 domain-containing protein n=1 Tax=Azospirillum rugosum TaxID=416170 RepID=A0ABS4STW7_9PROT|nr:DUF6468 domain-containing protein [Azospirillum rugosum]MBP2296006.1 hypothetical protein [Azospirillum rugosum]MDQ0529596.1 hypothetical protein [Azospirillum rugosum]
MVSFLIDAVLAVMLVTATVFLVIVNKRLKVMRASQGEIGALITTFSKTIDETEASVQRLVAAATEASAKLSDGLERARGVTEEVGLILGSCERASKRIEESVQEARALVRRLEDGPVVRPRPRPAPVVPVVEKEEEEPAAVAEERDDFRPMLASALARTQAELAELRAEPRLEAPADGDGARQAAASAFYARLRTVGTER